MAVDFFQYDEPGGPVQPAGRAILGGLTDEDWDKFIGFAARRRYAADAPLIKAMDTDRAIYFVVSGAVRILSHQPGGVETELTVMGEGDVFGIQSFLDAAPRAASAVAVGDVEVLMVSSDMFAQLAAWQPRIAVALLTDIGANISLKLRQHERSL